MRRVCQVPAMIRPAASGARWSMRKAAFELLLAAGAFATSAHAGVGGVLSDEFDDVDVVRKIQDNDARVKTLKADLDVVRKRLLRLKEHDFIALFGEKIDRPAKAYAFPCFEIRALVVGGIWTEDPEENHGHTDFHQVGDFAGVEVWYGIDGKTPFMAMFFFKTDAEFVAIKAADDLEKRLAWDRARWEFFNAWVEHRMAQVFPYEVDVEAMRKLYSGEESLDVRERLRAWIAAGERLGLTLKKTTSPDNATVSYSWLRPDRSLARKASAPGGRKGSEVPPSRFYLYHHNAPGKFSQKKRRVVMLDKHSRLWWWYRPDGTNIQCHSWQGSAFPFPSAWSWSKGEYSTIRYEWDGNRDGLPDWVATEFDENEEMKGRKVLNLNESWAIHPELVPEIARIPGDFQPRLIVRRRPEPKPLPPPPWARREKTPLSDSREAPSTSAAKQAAEESPGIHVSVLGFLAGALAVVFVWMLAWRLMRRRSV